MLNELNENSKSFRSIENSEIESLKKKTSKEENFLENDKNKKKSRNNKFQNSQSSFKELIQQQSSKSIISNNNNQELIKEEEKEINEPNNNNNNFIIPIKRYYNKEQNIISEDIREFQQKKECTYYQYGNFPVYQTVYFCDYCDTNSIEKICEYCYYECHSGCFGGNLGKEEEDDNSNGIPDNLFINYDEEENLKFMHGKFLTFICSCGLKRHKLKQVNDDTGTFQCNFLDLDIKLKNKAIYSCISCNINILCYICYIKCHQNCRTKKILTEDPNINVGKVCGCGNNINHTNRFILNKFISYIFHKQNNYDTIPYVLKIQLLNCIYDCEIYDLLYKKLNKFLVQKFTNNNINDINEVVIETLKRLVFNIVQVKQFYYFHDNIKKTLPLKNINLIIESINKNELDQYSSFISGLMNIILNVHIKSDFRKVKNFTYRDFIFTNLLQRILLKKKFLSNCLYIKDIKEKYFNNDKCIIPNLCIEYLKILNKILKGYDKKDILDCFDQFSIVFEMVHFCLSRFLADKNSLIKIIFLLEKVCLVFYLNTKNILTDGVDVYAEIVNIRKIRKIIDYISKIIYMIITNFNDAIIEEKLKLYNDNTNVNLSENNNKKEVSNEENILNDKFIQTLSSHSKKLFKIMSSTSIVYNTFILDNKINLKDNDVLDLLDFVNQGLEAFTLIDNSYFNTFNKISFADYYFFEQRYSIINKYDKIYEKFKFNFKKKKLFEKNNNETLDNNNNDNNLFKDFIEQNELINDFNDDIDTYEELISESDTSCLQKTIILSCYNNKERIETIYRLYFHSKIKFTDVDSLLYKILSNFDKFWKEEDKKVEKEKKVKEVIKTWRSGLFLSKKEEEMEEKDEIIYMELFMNENESVINKKKIINYRNKIIDIIKQGFPNMINDNELDIDVFHKDDININKEKEIYLDIILNELVLSNFDCILTPFLVIDPVMNRYSENTINLIFQFLLFYTLSKQSLIYFFSGKNLYNIIKILDLYPLQVLKFISLITEGVYLYGLDFHQHEQIPKLLTKIYNFIKKNISAKEEANDIDNIRKCIIYTMDILYYLSPNMEIENLTSINELIVEELQNLINQEKIVNMFPFQGLIKKYQNEKKMNLFLFEDDDKDEIEPYIETIILEDKSYLMNYIKNLFDSKVGNTCVNFPEEKANYERKEYIAIEYKEKDIYDYKLSEENKNFSDDGSIKDENDEIKENNNEPISNIENNEELKDELKDSQKEKEIELNSNKDKEIIEKSLNSSKDKEIKEDKDIKVDNNENKESNKSNGEKKDNNELLKIKNFPTDNNNIILTNKNDNSSNNQEEPKENILLKFDTLKEEENKKNEEENVNNSGSSKKFRHKKRNKTLNPKLLKASGNSNDSLKNIADNLDNQNINKFVFPSPISNVFTSKFKNPGNENPKNQLLRKSTNFKSKIYSQLFKREKTFVINEESSYEKSSSQGNTNKNKRKTKLESKSKLLRKPLINDGDSVLKEEQEKKILKIKNDQELFFSIIKLLSNITHFFMKKNDVFDTFLKINDLSFYQLLLKENYLTLEQRTNLLVFIRMVYINDQIDDQNSLILDKYMNNQEYYDNLSKLREILDDSLITFLPMTLENLKDKYNSEKQIELIEELEKNNSFSRLDNLNNLKIVIEILIHEIKNIFYLIYIENNFIVIDEYITQLIFTVKIISDIFITYDICSHLTIWFYELTKEFLAKLNFFISYLKDTKTKLNLNNLDISEYENSNIKKMEQKNFDIYNKEKIYEYILEGFQLIYSQNDFSQKFRLNTFLHHFSQKDENNFKNFTLNKTDIPFYAFNYDFYEYDSDIKKEEKKEKKEKKQIKDNFKEFKRRRKSLMNIKFDKKKEIKNDIKFDDFTKKICENFKDFLKIKDCYIDEFNQFFSSTFYESICCSSYETTLDCNKIFLNYCVVYLHNLKLLPSDNIVLFLSMLNKLLTFEPIKTQATLDRIFTLKNRLLNKDINLQKKIYFEETFFKNLTLILLEKININIATCKNIVIAERYEKINYVTKILIQFFQLLGEGHNKLFHNLIVQGKKGVIENKEKEKEKEKEDNNKIREQIINPENNPNLIKKISTNSENNSLIGENDNNKFNNVNVFEILCQSLNHVIRCFINYQNLILKGDLPYDKLIVMAHNIIDFIIEYFQGTNEKIYKIMYDRVSPIFPSMREFLFLSIDSEDEIENFLKKEISLKKVISNKKIFVYTIKIELILLICSLLEEGNAIHKNSNSLKDILEFFHPTDLFQSGVLSFYNLETYLPSLKEINLGNKESVDKLVDLYKYNEKFQISIELKYFTKIFYYLRLLSDLYEREEVKSFLSGLKKTYKLYEVIPNKSEKNITTIKTKTIKTINSIKIQDIKKEEKRKKEPLEKVNYILYLFANQLLRKIEIKSDIRNEDQKGESRDFTFFLIPPICLLLSQQTINYFYNHVDRSSVHSKIIGLIKETDYFICEMFYHKLYQMNYGSFLHFLMKINIQLVEMISYLFIIIQNLILVVHFYSKEPIPNKEKLILYLPNLIVGVVHIALMVIGLIIWFYFALKLEVIHNYMQNYNVKFLFRDNDTEKENRQTHFATLNEGVEDLSKLMDKLYSQIPLKRKIYTILFDSIIFNSKVNIILLTLLFEIIFLLTGNGILLAIPTLFIANMISLLRGIFLIFKLRWSQLLLVLTYSYLMVYNFSIFGFYYFDKSFVFSDLLDIHSGDTEQKENLCGNLLQCYLTLLSYGVRSGGGIGDVLPKLSFKNNVSSYIGRFFFDILFHIIIVLIMTNLIFGIIVDSFAAFRGSTDDSENDKNNICYICQLTRDDAINKNIDFNKHVKEVHDLWNYVYFLTYLHINNSNNFKMLETSVWDKLEESDTSWIPIKED